MSQTVGITRRNIRRLVNDTGPGDFACSEERLKILLDAGIQLLSDELNYADTWLTAAITLVNGMREYSLTASTDFRVVAELRRHDDNYLLNRRSMEVLDAMQQQTASVPVGKPTDYAVYEDATGRCKVVVFPTPNAAGTMDAFVSVAPDPLDTNDTNSIYLSTAALRALESRVAAEICACLTDEQQAKLKMGPGAAGAFSSRAEKMVVQEKERTATIRRSDVIERVRF